MVFVHRTSASGKSYNPVFSENEWAAIIEACHANEVPDTWVADGTCYKDMLINGTNYRIDIIGKNHDDLADGTGKAPLTFQLHDCYATTYPMNPTNTNVGGWRDCQMRTQTMPALKALMPVEVQAGIRAVNKLTSDGYGTNTISAIIDDLFLPSEIELFGKVTLSKKGEGIQYEYYTYPNRTIKYYSGNYYDWWERSPMVTGVSAGRFCKVNGQNGTAGWNLETSEWHIAFCFCF